MSKQATNEEAPTGTVHAEHGAGPSGTKAASAVVRKRRHSDRRKKPQQPSSQPERAEEPPVSRGFMEPELVDRGRAPSEAPPVGFLEPSSD